MDTQLITLSIPSSWTSPYQTIATTADTAEKLMDNPALKYWEKFQLQLSTPIQGPDQINHCLYTLMKFFISIQTELLNL